MTYTEAMLMEAGDYNAVQCTSDNDNAYHVLLSLTGSPGGATLS